MSVIRLRVSKLMLVLNFCVHIIAISAVCFSSVPALYSGLLTGLLLLSLVYQWQSICMQQADSIVALELRGEVCQPVFKDSQYQQRCAPLEISARVYSSGLLQILCFAPHQVSEKWRNNPARKVEGIIRSRGASRSLYVLRDSCSSEEWRQLRKFLRWRVCF